VRARAQADDVPAGARVVPSFEELKANPDLQIELFNAVREENHPEARCLAQRPRRRVVLQHPPLTPAPQEEVDEYYDLPYRREWHPDHDAAAACRRSSPCVGRSTRTAAAWPTARSARSRSTRAARSSRVRSRSVLREASEPGGHHDFRGTITDVGGPTANMWGMGCKLLEAGKGCLDRDCLSPDVCPALRIDRRARATAAARARQAHAGRQARVRQLGHPLRHAAQHEERDRGRALPLHHDIVEHHTPGRIKLAPEHASPAVLGP
jgi:hypothetical protein